MIKAVVFDIGNVLVGWNPFSVYDRLIGQKRRMAFFDAVPMFKYNERIDLGDSFDAVVADIAADYPEWAVEIAMWRDHWGDMVTPAIDHSVRLLRALRAKGIPVFALSNFGKDTFEIALDRYPFLREFDRAYVSGQMGMIKPYHQIYQAVERDCGYAPDELLFADDMPANIATAQERGWHTHLFQSAQGWADCLISHDLLTKGEAA